MSSNLQRDGDGDWVAAYGSPAISRPNSLSFHGSGTWAVGSRSPYRKSGEWAGGVGDDGGDEGDYGDEAAGGQGREGSGEDAPPAAIPPEELSKLAREAAEWDFAAVLQRRHSPRRRLAALFIYALGSSSKLFIILFYFLPFIIIYYKINNSSSPVFGYLFL